MEKNHSRVTGHSLLPHSQASGDYAGQKGGNMKDTYLHIRISSELKKQAQELATKDGRTLANWLEQLIRKEIEKAAEK